ncbi:hypothetical protein EDB89DRAFT_1847070, partial [Lactarius sanguifluus]
FGVMKRRFKVLAVAQEYSSQTQAQLVGALAVLHNFIRIHNPTDIIYGDDDPQEDEDGPRQGNIGRQERQRVDNRRERIAQEMWDDYVVHTRRRCD